MAIGYVTKAHAIHWGAVGTCAGVVLAIFTTIVGLAFYVGTQSNRIDTVTSNQTLLTAQYSALSAQVANDRDHNDQQQSRIIQSLTDIAQNQAHIQQQLQANGRAHTRY